MLGWPLHGKEDRSLAGLLGVHGQLVRMGGLERARQFLRGDHRLALIARAAAAAHSLLGRRANAAAQDKVPPTLYH